jgi:hypothetical protein
VCTGDAAGRVHRETIGADCAKEGGELVRNHSADWVRATAKMSITIERITAAPISTVQRTISARIDDVRQENGNWSTTLTLPSINAHTLGAASGANRNATIDFGSDGKLGISLYGHSPITLDSMVRSLFPKSREITSRVADLPKTRMASNRLPAVT